MPEQERIPNPLPTRFAAVKEKRDLLQQGLVLHPLDAIEERDISNAAQSIVAAPVLQDMIEHWRSPDLAATNDAFYQEFCLTYYHQVFAFEKQSWDRLATAVVSDPDLDLNALTPLQAAVLTLQSFDSFEEAALSSHELFIELAMHAREYKALLQKKLGDRYTDETFFQHLREHFPNFLKRIVALDSVVIDLYRLNAPEQDRDDPNGQVIYGGSKLDGRLYTLDDQDNFKIKPAFIERLKQLARDEGFEADAVGRTENRGCPFLLSDNRDAFINFAIEEFITQYKSAFEGVGD